MAARREKERAQVERARRYARANKIDRALRLLTEPIVGPSTRCALAEDPDFVALRLGASANGLDAAGFGREEIIPLLGGIRSLWSRSGPPAYGLYVDPQTQSFLASRVGGKTTRHTFDGFQIHAQMFSTDAQRFEFVPAVAGLPDMLVGHRTWARTLQSWSRDGNDNWGTRWYLDHELATALNDVAVGDIDGDGRTEILLVYNGAGGCEMLNASGESLQRYPDQRGKDLCFLRPADGVAQAAYLLAGRSLHALDRKGKVRSTFRLPSYGVELASAEGQLLVADHSKDRWGLSAYDPEGSIRWAAQPPGMARPTGIFPGENGLVVLTTHNGFAVMRLSDGAVCNTVRYTDRPEGQFVHGAAWVAGEQESLLLIATAEGLRAYTVQHPE